MGIDQQTAGRVIVAPYRVDLVDQDLRPARRRAAGPGRRRHNGKSVSTSDIRSIVSPSRTTVDGLAEINWRNWRLALNATNLLNNRYYVSCLARGDCFIGAPRNVMGTVGYRF